MKLSDDARARLELVEGKVMSSPTPATEVICAFNFSYFLFRERRDLKAYFECARTGLEDEGLLILDAYGGAEWMVHYDGVHANDLGHLVVAHRIFEKLLQSCSGLSLHTRALERTAPRWRDESTLSADYGHFLLLSAAAEMMNLDAIDRSIESWMWNRGFSDRPGTAGEF